VVTEPSSIISKEFKLFPRKVSCPTRNNKKKLTQSVLESINEVGIYTGRNGKPNVLIVSRQSKIIQSNCGAAVLKSHSPVKRKFSPKAKRASSQIRKKENCAMIRYWIQKEKLDKKYSKILEELAIEEAEEIKHLTSRILENKQKADGEKILEIVENVKQDYDTTKCLLKRQKIVEEEDLINEYLQKLNKNA
jgi:hypothetical protein